MTDLSQHWSQDQTLDHVVFIAGYMDAVGRGLTTDSELWAVTARDTGLEEIMREIAERSPVHNWSTEFDALVRDFLHLDPCGRLGFYLVEYICWFKEFTQRAKCFKLACEPLGAGTLAQAVYLLQLENDYQVVLVAQRIDKANAERKEQIERAFKD